MNQDQVFALLRDVLKFAGMGLVTRGYFTETTLMWVIGFGLAIAGTAWTQWTKRPTGIVQSAAALPEVAKVVAVSAIANGTLADNRKVTAN